MQKCSTIKEKYCVFLDNVFGRGIDIKFAVPYATVIVWIGADDKAKGYEVRQRFGRDMRDNVANEAYLFVKGNNQAGDGMRTDVVKDPAMPFKNEDQLIIMIKTYIDTNNSRGRAIKIGEEHE